MRITRSIPMQVCLRGQMATTLSGRATGELAVIRPERKDEDEPPENFLIKRSKAELRRMLIQSVNRAFALTLTKEKMSPLHQLPTDP